MQKNPAASLFSEPESDTDRGSCLPGQKHRARPVSDLPSCLAAAVTVTVTGVRRAAGSVSGHWPRQQRPGNFKLRSQAQPVGL